jgi:hypothetical protein
MHKVDVMYDIELQYLFDEASDGDTSKENKDKVKHVKISEKVFDHMLREGLIKKTDDGYVFVGKYKDTLELQNKKRKSD